MSARSFGLVVGLLLVSLAGAAGAQPSAKMARIGLISVGTDPARPGPQWSAFVEALRGLGYTEGGNIAIERRFAGGKSESLASFAAELVQLKVDVIVVTGPREVEAAHRATTAIPIVTVVAPDLLAAGYIASLARPGGNITGLTFSAPGVGEKYVELLREAVPSATRMAVMVTRQPPPGVLQEMRDAARALNVTLPAPTIMHGPDEFEPEFARAKREAVGGLIFPGDGVTNLHRRRLVDLAAKYRLPAIYTQRESVEAGGLMAYGPSFVDLHRRAATFVDKILKGARPADLPIEQPTKFDLLLNLKTARALGVTFPATLLARANEVVQ
jgi:putative tryptophan/tyrosine transport system substrate-binding protein